MNTTKRLLPIILGLGGVAGCDDKPKKVDPPTAEAGPTTGPVIIRKGDPVPRIEMGGAAAPMPRPKAVPGASGAAAGAAAAAPSPVAAVQIVHNHPPDQPCHPLTQQEIQKALDDMR